MENLLLFLAALAIGIIAAAVIFIPETRIKNIFRLFIALTIVYTGLGWWFFYFTLPNPVLPFFGLFGFALFIFWCSSAFICSYYLSSGVSGAKVYNLHHQIIKNKKRIKGLENIFPIIYIISFLVLFLISDDVNHKKPYVSILEEKTILENNTKKYWDYGSNQEKIISSELAIIYAKQALEQSADSIKNYFEVGETAVSLQIVKGAYWYIVPLDFKNKKSWELKKTVPGYFKVYARSPWCTPLFISGLKIKYTPGAYYSDNLIRHLYPKYYNRRLLKYYLQEDENERAFWVIEVIKTSYFYFNYNVEGKIILNPETGVNEYVSNETLANNDKYSWIDSIPVNIYRTDVIKK